MMEKYHDDGTLKYRGEVRNGERHGFGEEYNKNGELIYCGIWKKDQIFIPTFPKKYKLIKKNIGKGGQGTISLYRDTTTKELVVVKKYKKRKSGIYQYRNLQHLNKLNICKEFYICAFGLFQKNDEIYLVMEYLKDYIELSNVHVKKNERTLICQKIWNEVQLLHHHNIVHCDLKPDNIMVHPKTLKVNIIDFGGAILLSKDLTKKYRFKSFTRSYITLNPDKKYSEKELKKNDVKITLRIMYTFLFQTKTLPSYKKMRETLDKYLQLDS